jgi:ATP/maltotriose-dependent transcriptional regulator MalT
LLRLAQGRLDAADAMIRRVLHEARDPISRSRVLGSFVEIALAAGDVDAAGSAADELRDVAAALGAPLLRARATSAAGTVHFADGDEKEALVELRHAFNELNELGARYEAARTRLVLAQVCDALGDHDAAESESIAARAALESFRREPGVAVRTPGPDGLTQRELEVLRLLARGHTNRAIAEELVLSEKTVASHVSHIFTKTGVTSRSGATAYAYDHDLV